MPSVKEIADELRIEPVTYQEYRKFIQREDGDSVVHPILRGGRKHSYERQARMFDGKAMVYTAVIVPAVASRIAGSSSAIELGYGTGFRLLCYALNNTETQFVGVDRNPLSREVMETRMKRLGVSNVKLVDRDIIVQDTSDLKASGVIAIDIFDDKNDIRNLRLIHGGDPTPYVYARISMMVDDTGSNFLATMRYDIGGLDIHERYLRLIHAGLGFSELESVLFVCNVEDDRPKKGFVMFGRKPVQAKSVSEETVVA